MAAALVVALVTTAGVSAASAQAATPTFSAHGSAEQVYVTGLAPSARMSLLTPDGTTLVHPAGRLARRVCCSATCRRAAATACVLPGRRASPAPITVHSDAAAPWDPGIYNQSIPDNGYTYLTTRDGTQARDRRAPADGAGG